MKLIFSHYSYEEALAAAKLLDYTSLNQIVECLSSHESSEGCDLSECRDRIYDLLSEFINDTYHTDRYKSGFLAIELLHHKVGAREVKKIVTCKGNIFFDLGPSIYDKGYWNLFTRYFNAIGLEREMYLTYSESNGAYPVHYICSNSFQHGAPIGWLNDVPVDVLEEALLIQDARGNTPLHMALRPGVDLDIISYKHVFKAIFQRCRHMEYHKALHITNSKGRTPLHEMCAKAANCTKTLFYLISKFGDRDTCAIKDSKGRTPYDLCLKNPYFAMYDEIGTISILVVLKHFENGDRE